MVLGLAPEPATSRGCTGEAGSAAGLAEGCPPRSCGAARSAGAAAEEDQRGRAHDREATRGDRAASTRSSLRRIFTHRSREGQRRSPRRAQGMCTILPARNRSGWTCRRSSRRARRGTGGLTATTPAHSRSRIRFLGVAGMERHLAAHRGIGTPFRRSPRARNRQRRRMVPRAVIWPSPRISVQKHSHDFPTSVRMHQP